MYSDFRFFGLKKSLFTFAFLLNPIPGIKTTKYNTNNKKVERPGSLTGPITVKPETNGDTDESGNGYGPAYQSEHAKTEPSGMILLFSGTEFSFDAAINLLVEGVS